MAEQERSLAVFIDFENLALGFQGRRDRFDIQRVLKRLVEKGKIVAKKAYADWNRYASYTEALHEAAIELVEIPRRGQSGKNSADIRLCVDAMDLSYSKDHIDTFVVVSGDSDFSPLVSKLKELGKHVLGCGMQNSTSELLRDNCDEFIYYEDLEMPAANQPALDARLPEMKRKAFALLLDSLEALRRENKEVLWSSMIKDTMKRKKPAFNETYHGYRTFSALLEDAQANQIIELETDKRSGTYVVTRFGEELKSAPAAPVRSAAAPRERDRDRDRDRPRGRSGERSGDRRGPRRPRLTRTIAVPEDNNNLPPKPADAPAATSPSEPPPPSPTPPEPPAVAAPSPPPREERPAREREERPAREREERPAHEMESDQRVFGFGVVEKEELGPRG